MYKRLIIVLLVFLMFVNVPVYANEIYTIKQGKVYTITIDQNYSNLDVIFSDNVLYGFRNLNYYDDLTTYDSYGISSNRTLDVFDKFMFVYNLSDSDVIMTLNDGGITNIREYESPFGLVMYDGTNTVLEVTNNTSGYIDYKMLNYNDINGSISFDKYNYSIAGGSTKEIEGKGVLIFELDGGNLKDILTISGVYEVGDFVRYGFFQRVPWILEMDLMGIIRVFLEQLSMLLPVGLIVLSAFLLINLLRYTMRFFL